MPERAFPGVRVFVPCRIAARPPRLLRSVTDSRFASVAATLTDLSVRVEQPLPYGSAALPRTAAHVVNRSQQRHFIVGSPAAGFICTDSITPLRSELIRPQNELCGAINLISRKD